jgi:small subunit ribosomal protein S16
MAAKIKLQKIGAKNQPYFRVVVQDESSSTGGRVVEILGQYHPLREPTVFEVDREKTLEWIKKGAEPTEKVRILLGKAGILPPVDLAALPKKKKKGEAEKPAEPAPAEAKPLDTSTSLGVQGKEEQK